jgi:hypothetical protein
MTYRLLKIQDPRTPGFCWWEIEARAGDGTAETVAVCDTKEEARDTLKAMRAAA